MMIILLIIILINIYNNIIIDNNNAIKSIIQTISRKWLGTLGAPCAPIRSNQLLIHTLAVQYAC